MEKRALGSAASGHPITSSPGLTSVSTKKSNNIPASEGPAVVRSRNSGNGIKKSNSSNSQGPNGSSTFNENDTFNKHYNKELRVSKDEIPIVLAELNDSAIAFIKREQYEKALNLLQKAYGIMDVVEFNLCRRDKFHLFLLFHNMALCYQKMQMLEECAQCIEQALEFLPLDQFNLQEKSISNRMRKLQIMGKLKMQYCAILSQVHRHKDALDQAKEGVKISHLLINDMKQLCEFYVKREEIEHSLNNNIGGGPSRTDQSKPIQNQPDLDYSSYYSQSNLNHNKKSNSSRNRSFSQFLSQQEAYQGEDMKSEKQTVGGVFHRRNDSFSHNMSSFYSLNYLEESMSFVERTARKLLPILVELKKKMLPEKTITTIGGGSKRVDTLESFRDDDLSEQEMEGKKQVAVDMKNILGYLNQGEWTQTLSIGSIMQLQPFTLKDLLEQGKNELELTRDSFIAKVSFLAVSYFCYSTEIRFILQMKEDPTYEPAQKQRESEFWHAKSLEISCTFLPGECPLLNHINLSYQKHFAPVKTTILEDEPNHDDLIVVKPLNGIDNPKFQPIIRQVQNINIAITPYQMTPIHQVANQFLSQMISFNDYQEQVQQSQSYGSKQAHHKSKSGDLSSKQRNNAGGGGGSRFSRGSYDPLLLDENTNKNQSITQFDTDNAQQDDLQRFSALFDKLMRENKLDKQDLLRKLKDTKVLLNDGSAEVESSSQFNDLLLDEHILAEESIDEEQIAIEAKHQNSNSINLYKFRGKDSAGINAPSGRQTNERPKTSHSIHRQNSNSIGDAQQELEHSIDKKQQISIEEVKKRSQRPLSGGAGSGGLQKIKNDSQRSRINKMNQNYSMYEKFGQVNGAIGYSPDKLMGKNPAQNNTYQNNIQAPSYTQGQLKKPSHNKSFDSQQQQQQKIQYPGQINYNTNTQEKKINPQQNIQAYDELKRRLLNEYKKLTTSKKSFDDQVREKYKNLKQRGVSGKKPTNGHQVHGSIGSQSSQSQQQQPIGTSQANNGFQAQQNTSSGNSQLSPKHHLNVYKPTFIINNSFGDPVVGGGSGKEGDVVDQISKKYRPSSKSGSHQQTNQLTNSIQNIGPSKQVTSQPALYNERSGSQFNNQIQNSQQLMGLLMNAEKKSNGASGSKKQIKTLSQGAQDLSYMKSLLADKTNNSSLTKPAAGTSQLGFIQSSSGSNFNQMNSLQFQTQHQFNQPKILMGQVEQVNQKKSIQQQQQQQQRKPGSGGGIGVQIQQNAGANTQIPNNVNSQSQKLAAYEKLKKKLNYQGPK